MATDSQPTTPLSPWRNERFSSYLTPSGSPMSSPVRQRALQNTLGRSGSISLAGDQQRRPSCNISIDRIRAGSIFSPAESADHENLEDDEEESRRSSLATAVEEIPETPSKESRPERKDRFETMRTCLCKVRTPILVGVLSILVVWATNVVGITHLSNIIYRACQVPGVPTIASQFPMGLCSLAPPSDQTFAKVLDAQVKYEKIFKYVEKRATLPYRMTETAKKVDTKVDQSSIDEDKSEMPTIYSLENKFFHSAEFSHAVLDLGSFLKQAKETAQRLVVANQVAKASLEALMSKKTRWKFLNTDPFRTWEVLKIHDGLTETSMEQIVLVIDRAEVARKKIEDLEDGFQTTETSTVYSHFPVRDFSVHLQEAHALLEIVRDGTEKIKNDISEAQKHCRFFKKASHTSRQKMALESMITIWTNQLDHNIRLLGEALDGPRFVEATASSKTFGTIAPLFTTTPSLTPSLSPTSSDTWTFQGRF